MEIVDKYKNIPDEEFVPLDCLENSLNGVYEINKLGHLKTTSSGFIRESYSKDTEGYPYVTLTNKDGGKKVIRIHILLAKTFISNPDNKPIIDHIDRDRENYNLLNLRWVTFSENGFNRSSNSKYKSVRIIQLDDSGNKINEFIIGDFNVHEREKIYYSIKNNLKYNGFYWSKIDLEVESYKKKYGDPKEADWKPCLRDPYFDCNINGQIRIRKTKKIVSGTLYSGYTRVTHKRTQYFSHRLVYETFSGYLLPNGIVIDHLNGDRQDNRFCNLKECTQKENMNNPITISRKSKPVLQFSIDGTFIKEYASVKDALRTFSEGSCGNNFIRDIVSYGYLWCFKGEEDLISKKLKYIVFKYSKNGEFIKAYKSPEEAALESSKSNNTIRSYIKTEKLCSDGFYYSRGPREFKNNE
jgi:hypothetical protein